MANVLQNFDMVEESNYWGFNLRRLQKENGLHKL